MKRNENENKKDESGLLKTDQIFVWLFFIISDSKSFFSKNHGWDADMGNRNGRRA
jgi:hypothetical protein